MIDCMTLEQMLHFISLLGEIVTVFGDYEVVRIDADTATIWWFRAEATAGSTGGPADVIMCQGPEPSND